ncbi:unnamed protein product [Cuscuta epithymum]|uniref:Uncharacterized protein n=1 Tax=Cuscuta epithymum TaxID=186058 RepID=A0AAV0ED83_9ASTE|nr:unnamed protein product [Cuscuta epithymum]
MMYVSRFSSIFKLYLISPLTLSSLSFESFLSPFSLPLSPFSFLSLLRSITQSLLKLSFFLLYHLFSTFLYKIFFIICIKLSYSSYFIYFDYFLFFFQITCKLITYTTIVCDSHNYCLYGKYCLCRQIHNCLCNMKKLSVHTGTAHILIDLQIGVSVRRQSVFFLQKSKCLWTQTKFVCVHKQFLYVLTGNFVPIVCDRHFVYKLCTTCVPLAFLQINSRNYKDRIFPLGYLLEIFIPCITKTSPLSHLTCFFPIIIFKSIIFK